MVGVPGKSKGCSTCRRRKKGCDQKRPVCGQCSASGYVCGGYQRNLTFVLHPASKMVEKARFLPTQPRLPSLGLHSSLERSAVVTQCQSIFFDVYLPHGRCVVSDQFILKCGCSTNWTSAMQSFTPNETPLELAFAAFSISRVGNHKEDPRLIKESTKFYGKALKTLQKALYETPHMQSEQVLTACLLLCLYEAFEGAGSTSAGWVSHAQGTARVLELRGPERHSESPAHTLFLGTRLPIVYASIIRRKHTFLCTEDWLAVPWRSKTKSGVDRLVDIMTHVPSLLEQFDAVNQSTSPVNHIQGLQSCLSFCHQLQKSLSTWDAIRRPNSQPVIVDLRAPADGYPFLQELTYENHLFLNANLIYWSTALLVSTTIAEIEFNLAGYGFEYPDVQPLAMSATNIAYESARNIAQSIPYCLWPEMGDMGIDYIQFPMYLAFQYFLSINDVSVCTWILERGKEMQRHPDSTSSQVNYPVLVPKTSYDLAHTGLPHPQTTEHDSPIPTSIPLISPILKQSSGQVDSFKSYPDEPAGTPITPHAAAPSSVTPSDPDLDADHQADGASASHSLRFHDTESQSTTNNSYDEEADEFVGFATIPSRSPSFPVPDFIFIRENPAKFYTDKSELST